VISLRVDLASANVQVSVPQGARSLIGFSSIGPIANNQKFTISADLTDSYNKIAAGQAKGVICISDRSFETGQFPVSQGEKLLVSCETTGTALLYFDENG